MRKFEKISNKQFKKDIGLNDEIYQMYELPKRSTKFSAGYDIKSLYDFKLLPNESLKVATGIKVAMEHDEVFMVYVRSSVGIKYNVTLMNGVGIIDSDYYNNSSNEGHLFIALKNNGDKEFNVKAGEAMAQGIFTKYLTIDDEKEITSARIGGIGSTNEEGK